MLYPYTNILQGNEMRIVGAEYLDLLLRYELSLTSVVSNPILYSDHFPLCDKDISRIIRVRA